MTILQLDNLSFAFPHSKNFIISDLNFSINSGDFIVLLGSNGSGKSTLLKLISRQIYPTSGHIYLKNRLLTTYSQKKLSTTLSVLTQTISDSLFMSLTIYENYLLRKNQRSFLTSSKNEKKFLANYLQDFNENLITKLDCIVDQLSGGEKQALALALCLLNPPSILLLDEHTSALDPKTSVQIMQLTKNMAEKYGMTCIMTTHDLSQAKQYATKILALGLQKQAKFFDLDSVTRNQLMQIYG
ncbi:MAG: hypothetical protein ACD_46C00549G0001 [uncultured bacterium]|nr:MAG: hypothetical protein ACD_46C00549G0001 [uncultured bacterium]